MLAATRQKASAALSAAAVRLWARPWSKAGPCAATAPGASARNPLTFVDITIYRDRSQPIERQRHAQAWRSPKKAFTTDRKG
jgi:hypothetical protein